MRPLWRAALGLPCARTKHTWVKTHTDRYYLCIDCGEPGFEV